MSDARVKELELENAILRRALDELRERLSEIASVATTAKRRPARDLHDDNERRDSKNQ